MIPYIKTTSHPDLSEQKQIINLLDVAFNDKIYSTNTHYSFFNGYISNYENFVLLKESNNIIGIAIVAKRKINIFNGFVEALSIGPVAIAPAYQRQGLSNQLMAGVDQLGKQYGITMLYLQGIDGFYNRHGFYACSSKSKLVFKENDIEEVKGITIRPLKTSDIETINEIYQLNSSLNSCTSIRSKEDWDWLVNYASKTWYFFRPTIVLNKGKVIGYFCSDPKQPGRIREAIYYLSDHKIKCFLAGLKVYIQRESAENIELMTWIGSPLYIYTQKYNNAEFIQFFKKNGSQMIKILDYQYIIELINKCLPPTCSIFRIEVGNNCCHILFGCDRGIHSLSIQNKYIPGIISGYFNHSIFQGYDKMDVALKENLFNFINSIKKPFFYQGDNL